MPSALHISIGLNVALAGAIAVLVWRDNAKAPLFDADAARPASEHRVAAAQGVAQPAPGNGSFTPEVVAQFQRMGIPRDTIVNVLLENLNRQCGDEVLRLQKKYAPGLVPDREYLELSRRSDAERIRALKEALGEQGYRAWDKDQTLRTLNHAGVQMSDAEADKAYELQKEFDRNNRELQMAMEDGIADKAEVGTAQAYGKDALDRELEKLLGKQRFDELRGNTDPAAEVYRTYGGLKPTPEQAKAALQAEQDYRDRQSELSKRLNENPGDAASITGDLKAMNDAHEESLRQIFGADAYENAKQQNDPTYKTLSLYAETWSLNDQEVQSVYKTLHSFEAQADSARQAAEISEAAGQQVNWREINSSIEQSRQQTESSLQNLIGAERLRHLKENGLLTTR